MAEKIPPRGTILSPWICLAPGEHAVAPGLVSSRNVRPSAAMPRRQSLVQSRDEIISEHVYLIWFDSIPEYLVSWQIIMIGNGALP